MLSDYIVKNRGILPGSARDAYDQYREVEAIVMSTYKACVETDEEGNGDPFTAQVIHSHCTDRTVATKLLDSDHLVSGFYLIYVLCQSLIFCAVSAEVVISVSDNSCHHHIKID